jgi:hypothetical protein
LYFSAYGWTEIRRCDLPDCANEVSLATGIYALGLAVDATHLYFVENNGMAPTTENAYIGRCPLAGSEMDGPEVVVSEDISPYAVAVDDARIYFTNFVHGTVVSIPK